MTGMKSPAVVRRLLASNVLAHAQRTPPRTIDKTMTIAVAALDERILSTPISASIGILLNAVAQQPVVLVDGDGINQPLRGPIGAGTDGDLIGLAEANVEKLNRATIETFADTTGTVALLSNNFHTRVKIQPEILDTAVSRVAHRWPTVVIDLPFTCLHDTISAGTALAKHVILVTDKHHTEHGWLYRKGHQLTQAANEGRVTVVRLGGGVSDNQTKDTFSMPSLDLSSTSRDRIHLPTDSASLTMYHRLLARLYP